MKNQIQNIYQENLILESSMRLEQLLEAQRETIALIIKILDSHIEGR